MHVLIRNLAVLMGVSFLALPLLATVLLFSSLYASDTDNGNMLISRLDNSSLQKNIIDTAEAFYAIEQPLQEITGIGDQKALSYHLRTDINNILQKIKFGDNAGKGLVTVSMRNRMAQPIAMIILGVGMIALATFRRKRTRRQSQAKPQPNAAISRMAIRIQ
jgi:hypothetical protein